MQILALGNKKSVRHRQAQGFTLFELLIVVTLIAIGTAGVSFAFRDSESSALSREADRLAAILETQRIASRSTGVGWVWLPQAGGFSFVPLEQLKSKNLPEKPQFLWTRPSISAEPVSATFILLGPEPILPAQQIELRMKRSEAESAVNTASHRIRLVSNGIASFDRESEF